MQYVNSPQYAGLPMDPYASGQGLAQFQNQQIQYQQQIPQRPQVDPRVFDTPEITLSPDDGTVHKPLFSVSPSQESNTIHVDNLSDAEVEATKPKRGGGKKKNDSKVPIVRESTNLPDTTSEKVAGEVMDSTIYTYQETNGLLHETLGQIDAINIELVQEFNAVRQNRTMKNKYGILNELAENIGAMVSNRISTIKEINNCITKANDMDYKKYKDIQAAQSTMNDDKYIADMYQAFLANPQAQPQALNLQAPGPQIDPSVMGSGIVRATVTSDMAAGGAPMDAGYLGYLSNLTPEQNLMRYENNPDVKQVVVYDASNGNRFFQIMNTRTGEVINNVPTYGDMIMEDTTLDLKTGVAKNININETFPIVQINNQITSQY